MSSNKKDKPRTGDGHQAKGQKPGTMGKLILTHKNGRILHPQPKGWAVANVLKLVRGKHRKGR